TVINPDNLTLEYRGYINRHPPGGYVVMDEVTGEWTFFPNPDFVGATYAETSACDTYLGRCAYQGLRITVTSPVLPATAVDDAYVLGEDTTLAAGSVLANDTTAGGTPLVAVKASDPAHGTL